MKEQLLTPYQSGIGLAIPVQNSYSLVRGEFRLMPDGAVLTPEAPTPGPTPQEKPREVKQPPSDGVFEQMDEYVNGLAGGEGQKSGQKAEQKQAEDQADRAENPFTREPKTPQVKEYADQLKVEVRRMPLTSLSIEELQGKYNEMANLQQLLMDEAYQKNNIDLGEQIRDDFVPYRTFFAQEVRRRIQEGLVTDEQLAKIREMFVGLIPSHELDKLKVPNTRPKRPPKRGGAGLDILPKIAGGAGAPAAEFANFDPNVIAVPLQEIARDIKIEGEGRRADEEFLASAEQLVKETRQANIANPDVVTSARNILDRMPRWKEQARRATAQEREAARDIEHEQEEERYEKRPGIYGERKLRKEDKLKMRTDLEQNLLPRLQTEESELSGREMRLATEIDHYFNRIFETRTDNKPVVDFRSALETPGSIEVQDFFNALKGMQEFYTEEMRSGIYENNRNEQINRRLYKLVDRLIVRYAKEYQMRKILHDSYYIAETGGEMKEFAGITHEFSSDLMDLAFVGSPEVEFAFRLREQVLYEIKRENNGFIPPELVSYNPERGFSDFDKRTEELLKKANRNGLFKKDPNDPNERELEPWRIARALSLSRGLGIVTLRFPEIVAECYLPAAPDDYKSQKSIPWETISWELNPLDHKIKRYQIARQMGAVFYFSQERGKKPWWKSWEKEELEMNYALNAITALGDPETQRIIDMRNLFKIGGPATHSGWRTYDAALDANGRLKPVLGSDPGIGVKVLWDRYLYKDMAQVRERMLDEWRRDNPGISQAELSERWRDYKKTLEKSKNPDENPEQIWRREDKQAFRNAARRIPHVILRVITDSDNALLTRDEREALLRDIFGPEYAPPVVGGGDMQAEAARGRFNQLYSQTEQDLTFAKENLLKRRRELLQAPNTTEADRQRFLANEDQLLPGDFDAIERGDNSADAHARRTRARTLHQIVMGTMQDGTYRHGDKDLLTRIQDKVGARGFPFMLTAEDVPWNEFEFGKTGPRGTVTRRINDFFAEVGGNQKMIELVLNLKHTKDPAELGKALVDIFTTSQVHDWDRAEEAMEILAKGMIRIFQKDSITNLPLVGDLVGIKRMMSGSGSSFAQHLWGHSAMAWDPTDVYNFTEQLQPLLGREKIKRLRKETDGTFWRAMGAKSLDAFMLLFMVVSYQTLELILNDKYG